MRSFVSVRVGVPRVLVSLVLAASFAGCGSDPSETADDPSDGTASASPSASESAPSDPSSSAEPTAPAPADPAHAVDPPGRRTAPLQTPDILVFDTDSLSEDLVEQIRATDGVAAVESFSLAQAVIENRAVNVAAVDPDTYRLFTPSNSADLLEQWQRVAGGELAVVGSVRKLEDDEGYLKLGSSDDAPSVHIGAYAPQVPQVDAVVNESWVDDLQMAEGNALLISTGQAAPSAVSPAIQKIVASSASVQNLDVVARLGLDINATQTAFVVGSVADAVGTFNYRVLGGGRIAPDPAWVESHISTETVPILGQVTCNTKLFPQLRAALQEIVETGLADEIYPDEYAGCYYPRFIAGTSTLSNHSFGLALDLNTPGNGRGTVGEMDRTVVAIFKKWGFAWGGDWNYTDPMHFEMAELVNPR